MLISSRQAICMLLFAFTLTSLGAADKNKLTLRDAFVSDKFDGRTISSVQWQPDSKAFTFILENPETGAKDIYRHDVASGETELVLTGAGLKLGDEPVIMSSYEMTNDGNRLLITGEVEKIWRHSAQAPHYLYNMADGEMVAVADGSPTLRNVKLSPDGRRVGFVRDSNLYIRELDSGQEVAITTTGDANILHGEFDWVYEEEFGLADAWRWSPDGSQIAFWSFDQSRVKEFHLVDELPIYNEVRPLKYPKAGEMNSRVKIGVTTSDGKGETRWFQLDEEFYIPRIYWTNRSDLLAILKLNRRQNELSLVFADVKSGALKTILTDSDPAWIDVEQDIYFLSGSDRFVWLSERSGYKHAYLYNYAGEQVRALTSGDWEISKLLGVDETGDWVYFAGKKDSPLENNIYRARLSGSEVEKISHRPGWHDGVFSPDHQHVVGFFSDVETPTQVMLRKSDGSLVRFLEKNEITALADYDLIYPEFTSFTTSDGVELNAYFMKPKDFDPDKKYPVVVYGYGGPGSQMVVNRWGTGSRSYHVKQRTLWHNILLNEGYLIFCLDNRGTGGRGKAFENLVYKDLGKWVVNDHVEGAKYLASLPYVDADRVGFWGWSGGGYLALMLMTRANDYFKAAIAVAPVSDFRFYDTIWTERYMGLPEENVEGYREASVLTKLSGYESGLLLVHGTGDDNVHWQNAVHVIDGLQKLGKQFDLMIYPNKNHRISGGLTQYHLFTKMTDFFNQKL